MGDEKKGAPLGSLLSMFPSIAGALANIIVSPEKDNLKEMQAGRGVGSRAISAAQQRASRDQLSAQAVGHGATRGLGILGASDRANDAAEAYMPALGMTAAREQALATAQLRNNDQRRLAAGLSLGTALGGGIAGGMAMGQARKDQGEQPAFDPGLGQANMGGYGGGEMGYQGEAAPQAAGQTQGMVTAPPGQEQAAPAEPVAEDPMEPTPLDFTTPLGEVVKQQKNLGLLDTQAGQGLEVQRQQPGDPGLPGAVGDYDQAGARQGVMDNAFQAPGLGSPGQLQAPGVLDQLLTQPPQQVGAPGGQLQAPQATPEMDPWSTNTGYQAAPAPRAQQPYTPGPTSTVASQGPPGPGGYDPSLSSQPLDVEQAGAASIDPTGMQSMPESMDPGMVQAYTDVEMANQKILEATVRLAQSTSRSEAMADIPLGTAPQRAAAAKRPQAPFNTATVEQQASAMDILEQMGLGRVQPPEAYTQIQKLGISNPEALIGWSPEHGR